jgi:hypothetical protein
MLNKSLSINEEIGRIEGIASDYRDWGILTYKRGDQVSACVKLNRSRDMFEMIGMRMEEESIDQTLKSMPLEHPKLVCKLLNLIEPKAHLSKAAKLENGPGHIPEIWGFGRPLLKWRGPAPELRKIRPRFLGTA